MNCKLIEYFTNCPTCPLNFVYNVRRGYLCNIQRNCGMLWTDVHILNVSKPVNDETQIILFNKNKTKYIQNRFMQIHSNICNTNTILLIEYNTMWKILFICISAKSCASYIQHLADAATQISTRDLGP